MPKEIEILPPSKNALTQTTTQPPVIYGADVPTVSVGGDTLDFFFNRRRWEKQARAVDALTRLNRSEVACIDAQTAVVEADNRLQAALVTAAEVPERVGHELQLRRAERAEELRKVGHGYGLKEMQRERERLASETETNQVKVALLDSQQQLQAQRDFGYAGYVLAWKKKSCDLVGLELGLEERRALVREYVQMSPGDAGQNAVKADDDTVGDALYEARAELEANGLDTSRIDALIQRRQRR